MLAFDNLDRAPWIRFWRNCTHFLNLVDYGLQWSPILLVGWNGLWFQFQLLFIPFILHIVLLYTALYYISLWVSQEILLLLLGCRRLRPLMSVWFRIYGIFSKQLRLHALYWALQLVSLELIVQMLSSVTSQVLQEARATLAWASLPLTISAKEIDPPLIGLFFLRMMLLARRSLGAIFCHTGRRPISPGDILLIFLDSLGIMRSRNHLITSDQRRLYGVASELIDSDSLIVLSRAALGSVHLLRLLSWHLCLFPHVMRSCLPLMSGTDRYLVGTRLSLWVLQRQVNCSRWLNGVLLQLVHLVLVVTLRIEGLHNFFAEIRRMKLNLMALLLKTRCHHLILKVVRQLTCDSQIVEI